MSIINWYKKQNIFGGKIHFFVLIFIAISLPLSPYILSMTQIWLAMNYLLEGKYIDKLKQIGNNKILWAFLLFPAIHLLGLINTSNFDWAGHDLLIKLPALSFPIILATTTPLSKKRLHIVMWFFVAACFSGTVISMFVKAGYIPSVSNDHRGISIFISHIRFSLMIVLALFFIITNLIKNFKTLPIRTIFISFILIIWFLYFLGILQVMVSWVILVILITYIIIHLLNKIKNNITKFLSLTTIAIIPFLIFLYILNVYNNFKVTDTDISKLPAHTINGNEYSTYIPTSAIENGNYTFSLMCDKELETEWNKRSNIPYSGTLSTGHSLKYTLIRFLTSKGFSKDSVGISMLTNNEISAIENNTPNCIYLEKSPVYVRIYEVIWEINAYISTDNASGMSAPMRIEFLKAGYYLLKENLIWGTGTGDIKDEYNKVYDKIDSNLENTYRLRAHNQYLTFFITFGLIGGIMLIISMTAPYFMVRKKSMALTCFFIIIIISMISEDTLETQAGITFYSLFYPLLVYNNKNLS